MIKKLLVAGGGTGGHVNAGVSIVEHFRKLEPEIEVLFVGTKRGLESKIVPTHSIPIKFINSRGLKRENFFIFIYSLLLLPISALQSFFILAFFKPKVVIGVGGFASGPLVICASFLKIKTYILEQNTIMGFTNKALAKYVKNIFIAYPLQKIEKLKAQTINKIILTGNPIRQKISEQKILDNKVFNLFIFGGSQGARAINYAIINILSELEKISNLKIYHQTGELDFTKVKKEYETHKLNYELFPYIIDIEKIYSKSNLIISRSGASSISELIVTTIPSILIPLPTAADNHQYYNAKYLEDMNACFLIEQNKLNGEILIKTIVELINNNDVLNNLKKNLLNIKNLEKQRGLPEDLIYKTVLRGIND